MKTQFDLTPKQKVGLKKIYHWLDGKMKDDMTGTIEKSRDAISFILAREYYTTLEKDLLNELRSQYVEENVGKKK